MKKLLFTAMLCLVFCLCACARPVPIAATNPAYLPHDAAWGMVAEENEALFPKALTQQIQEGWMACKKTDGNFFESPAKEIYLFDADGLFSIEIVLDDFKTHSEAAENTKKSRKG
jgi:hypothetical protein